VSVPRLRRDQVLAWRLSAHGLGTRLPRARRAEAVRPVGLRTGGPDSALVGWHARAEGADAAELAAALVERRWVDAPTVRGTRILDPADLGTLTAGALPLDDGALADRLRRRRLGGDDPGGLLRAGREAAAAALGEGPRSQAELSRIVTAALPEYASAYCRPCGAVHVDAGLFHMVALAVGWVRAHGVDRDRFARPDLWLTSRHPLDADPGATRLLRWYLRAHSPSTPQELARYLGIGPGEARDRWGRAGDLAEVEYAGRRAWLPAADLDDALHARLPAGVRLLPPYDAALEGPDRTALVPEPALQREVWRTVANPGIAIVDGAVSCAWRATKRAGRLEVGLLPLDGWRPAHQRRVAEGLADLAPLRGAELGTVEVS
jgi:winged helix DNA-binding protein